MSAEAPIFSEVSGFVERVSKLFQLDAILLTIETKQNLRSILVSIAIFAAAAVAALLGVIVLLIAIVLFLIQLGIAPSLAALIVAVVLLVVAAVLAFTGLGRIKRWSLAPKRTISQFKRNIETLRASLSNEPRTNS